MSLPDAHKDQGPTLLGVSWSLTLLATIFMAMRYHCRINYSLQIWWDDLWMTATLVSCFAPLMLLCPRHTHILILSANRPPYSFSAGR